MIDLFQQKAPKGSIIKSSHSPFINFIGREVQQIYMLELRTNQMIQRLLARVVYQPLKNAMLNYQNVSKDHLSCLRRLGVRSSKVSEIIKKSSELLILPFTMELENSKEDGTSAVTMITGIQRILFYQMAVYRSLYTAAKKLYNLQWAESFENILSDKRMNDSIFSEIALTSFYPVALAD